MGGIGAEYLQGLVRSSQQLATELGVRTLGAAPSLPRNLLSGLRRSQTPLQLVNQAAKGKIRFSPADEAVRELKIAIDQYCREKSGVIGVTSARTGEGKTTLAFNLALLAASSGRRTLLIDANLRNRKLSSFLATGQTQGLSVLAEQGAELSQCVINWEETFAFLGEPAEVIKHHPSEILCTPAMATHLKTASNEFDCVIIDLPQATNCSEVQALAPLIDGFVFSVEWGKTSIRDLERAIAGSDVVAQRLIGVVLNKVPDSECAAV
jgi:succinoglycan biosynthesis transport protein ExoP